PPERRVKSDALGRRQTGKAAAFGAAIWRFESSRPSQNRTELPTRPSSVRRRSSWWRSDCIGRLLRAERSACPPATHAGASRPMRFLVPHRRSAMRRSSSVRTTLLAAVLSASAALAAAQAVCDTPTTLCLVDNRFQVTVNWTKPDGTVGTGTRVKLTDESGYF